MAKLNPTDDAVRRAYRERLNEQGQRPAFDKLVRLIDAPRDDLTWHYAVGVEVARLRPQQTRGTRWAENLAEALGPSRELLMKALRFVELYPEREGLEELERLGVNWTRLYFTFVIEDRQARHELLQEAVGGRWSDRQLRFTVQQRFPSNRRGIGGRPRRPTTGHGPEVALREVLGLCRRLTEYHEGVWSRLRAQEWNQLLRNSSPEERARLLRLLTETDTAVASVAEVCEQVRERLASLLPQAT